MNRLLIAFGVLVTPVLAALVLGCGGKKTLSNLTASEMFQEGKRVYDKGKYLKAIDIFQTCVYNYPGATVVDSAQYYLALSYFGNEEYEVARVEFNRLAVNYPSSVYFENAIFMRAVCYFESAPSDYGYDQTELETAVKQLEDFIIDFPDSDAVEDARKYLLAARTRQARKLYDSGIVYSRTGAYKAAKIYFQQVIDDYTDTEFAPPATYYIAEMDFKMKKYAEAAQGFKSYVTVFPDHEFAPEARQKAAEAMFKAAEASFKEGDWSAARTAFESFKADYPKDERIEKADEYLDRIPPATADTLQVENADS